MKIERISAIQLAVNFSFKAEDVSEIKLGQSVIVAECKNYDASLTLDLGLVISAEIAKSGEKFYLLRKIA